MLLIGLCCWGMSCMTKMSQGREECADAGESLKSRSEYVHVDLEAQHHCEAMGFSLTTSLM